MQFAVQCTFSHSVTFKHISVLCLLQLQRTNPFVIGDSSKENTRLKMDEFCARLQKVNVYMRIICYVELVFNIW